MKLALVRHLVSIAILPFTVVAVIPAWVARGYGIDVNVSHAPAAAAIAGAALLLTGFAFFASSLRRFATEGEGTLAPWDPPRKLVVAGPYRFVRNPMISGVVLMLFGEAALWRSVPHLGWAATFLAINLVYIPLVEEPMLRLRFGAAYDEYRRHVPALIPRVTPWTGAQH